MVVRRRAGTGHGGERGLTAPGGDATPLPALPGGWQAVRHAVLAEGTLAVLATDVDLAGAWLRFRKAWRRIAEDERPDALARRATARVFLHDGSGWRPGSCFPLETTIPLFDRHPNGDWLVVGAHARPAEAAARRIAPDGSLVCRFVLGDGIEHVGVDASDRTWVGWYDEGVFGNERWRVPRREWPPSSGGVASFNGAGEPGPELNWPEGVSSPADCYALNATGAGVWICPYTHFPIVRVGTGAPMRWWRNGLAGARALAVDGSHLLLAGGYGADAGRLALLALPGAGYGEQAEVLARWTLPLGPDARADLLAGRGDTIHLVDAGVWRRWRVGALVDLVTRPR